MKDMAALKSRYQRDDPAIRLGGLASNMARIGWFIEHGSPASLGNLFRESKYFVEWVAQDSSSDIQVILAELQLQLAIWERRWSSGQSMTLIVPEAQRWSQELLARSGLVD